METGRSCQARWRIAATARNIHILIGQIACQSSSLRTVNYLICKTSNEINMLLFSSHCSLNVTITFLPVMKQMSLASVFKRAERSVQGWKGVAVTLFFFFVHIEFCSLYFKVYIHYKMFGCVHGYYQKSHYKPQTFYILQIYENAIQIHLSCSQFPAF